MKSNVNFGLLSFERTLLPLIVKVHAYYVISAAKY